MFTDMGNWETEFFQFNFTPWSQGVGCVRPTFESELRSTFRSEVRQTPLMLLRSKLFLLSLAPHPI